MLAGVNHETIDTNMLKVMLGWRFYAPYYTGLKGRFSLLHLSI